MAEMPEPTSALDRRAICAASTLKTLSSLSIGSKAGESTTRPRGSSGERSGRSNPGMRCVARIRGTIASECSVGDAGATSDRPAVNRVEAPRRNAWPATSTTPVAPAQNPSTVARATTAQASGRGSGPPAAVPAELRPSAKCLTSDADQTAPVPGTGSAAGASANRTAPSAEPVPTKVPKTATTTQATRATARRCAGAGAEARPAPLAATPRRVAGVGPGARPLPRPRAPAGRGAPCNTRGSTRCRRITRGSTHCRCTRAVQSVLERPWGLKFCPFAETGFPVQACCIISR